MRLPVISNSVLLTPVTLGQLWRSHSGHPPVNNHRGLLAIVALDRISFPS
jgi:hypothetical protein